MRIPTRTEIYPQKAREEGESDRRRPLGDKPVTPHWQVTPSPPKQSDMATRVACVLFGQASISPPDPDPDRRRVGSSYLDILWSTPSATAIGEQKGKGGPRMAMGSPHHKLRRQSCRVRPAECTAGSCKTGPLCRFEARDRQGDLDWMAVDYNLLKTGQSRLGLPLPLPTQRDHPESLVLSRQEEHLPSSRPKLR